MEHATDSFTRGYEKGVSDASQSSFHALCGGIFVGAFGTSFYFAIFLLVRHDWQEAAAFVGSMILYALLRQLFRKQR